MGNRLVAIRALEAECAEIYRESRDSFMWRGQRWPSIMHACIATSCCDSIVQDEIRKASSLRRARVCARHLRSFRSRYFPPGSSDVYEKQQLFELRALLVEWRVQQKIKVLKAAE